MTQCYLHVKRHPYEEPYHTQLEIIVSNGKFSGWTDIYCNVEEISKIGEELIRFPLKIGHEFVFEYGTSNPKDRFYRHFRMRAYTTDGVGHCAIQFTINLNQQEPDEGICQFSFPVEVSALSRLGQFFSTFSKLQHLELRWSPSGGALFETYQVPGA